MKQTASALALHTHLALSLQYGHAPLKQKLKKKMTTVLQARLFRTCFERQILILFSIVSHKSERSPLMMRGRVHAVRDTVACVAGLFSLPPRAPFAFHSRLKPPFPSLSNTWHADYR